MNAPIISIRHLSKRYKLGLTFRHDTLRDQIAAWFKRDGATSKSEPKEIWALRDVSFDVQEGEVIGIIGRNGAGKSTLLKILGQITEPTEGEVIVRGRLASLLEVGTGFHQELTGRENIFLNGAILGMSKAEIQRKFDEIVAFAEVEKFLDTPVKRYSSGMYVRLAFAVAAHLEPDILLVDEVLAVGDAAFQAKCLDKMREVSQQRGRTVLFVSHNMAAIQALCGKAAHLKAGSLAGFGPVEEQIRVYLGEIKKAGAEGTLSVPLGGLLELRKLEFTPQPVVSGQDLHFTCELASRESLRLMDLHLIIMSGLGVRVAIVDLRHPEGIPHQLRPGELLRFNGVLKNLPLVEGEYRVGLFQNNNHYYGDYLDLATFTVANAPTSGPNVPYKAVHRGFVELQSKFDIEHVAPKQTT